jgi:hypothetical protein
MLSADCGYSNAEFGRKLLVHYGPEIGVVVGFDPSYRQNTSSPPNLVLSAKVAALLDTGARESCIDLAIAEKMTLPVIDRRPVSAAGGVGEADFHLAQIHVPKLRFTITGRFAALPLARSGFRHEVILGRSFLDHFRLTYDGPTADVQLAIE